ncbi:MAG: rRNA maturation RNase YbeY [Dysgonamonadaceae bacterium]|jgi:rRNA maturation RNase YbeY|nr:rRNA maturation RNase YbeY [Dysgonamonadaceae bacterium]
MPIIYYAEDVRLPMLKKTVVSRWIKNIAMVYEKRVGAIAFLFCTDEKILKVNRRYLHHDYYTDVITFDYTVGIFLSGDIYISLDTVRSNSSEFQTPYIEELYRVMIHGVLHLCGLDDQTPEDREKMTSAEDEALASLLFEINANKSK